MPCGPAFQPLAGAEADTGLFRTCISCFGFSGTIPRSRVCFSNMIPFHFRCRLLSWIIMIAHQLRQVKFFELGEIRYT